MEDWYRRLPKVELHLHLDCCLSYDAVQRLDPSITPEAFHRDFIAPAKCRNLADYLRTPPHFVRLMQTEEGLRVAVEDLFGQLAAENVLYA
jgi:adenosine deaminase